MDREHDLEHELSNLIGRHADWLDGRTWQRLTQQLAEGYFDVADLDRVQVLTPEEAELADALKAAMVKALEDDDQ